MSTTASQMRLLKRAVTAALITSSLSLAIGRTTTSTRSVPAVDPEDKITTKALMTGKIKGVTFRPNVPFLDSDRLEKLDVYSPTALKGGDKVPAIVMIHGGGWVGGIKDANREVQAGTAFARAGYVAVSVEYMKEPGKRWPTNLHDCKNAVRWVRKNADELHVDPENIGVIGGSAGGHLALMVAYTSGVQELEPSSPYPGISSGVQACVDLYGITNVATRKKTKPDGTPTDEKPKGTALFTESLAEAPEKWAAASPVTYVKKDVPPTLILHGTADATVDRDQATELATKLKEAGAEYELNLIPGAPHTFLLYDKRLSEDVAPQVFDFFDRHLKN